MKTFTTIDSLDTYFRKLPIAMRNEKAELAWDIAVAVLNKYKQVKFKWNKTGWFQVFEPEFEFLLGSKDHVAWTAVLITKENKYIEKYEDNVNGNPDYDSDDVLKNIKVNNKENYKIVSFGIRCIAIATVIFPDGTEHQIETDADDSDDSLSDHIGAIQNEIRKAGE